MSVYFRYILLHDIGTVWVSGFDLTPFNDFRCEYACIGQFTCARNA